MAQTARVKGVILDEFNEPIENVSITVGEKGTVSDKTGFYLLEVPANKQITIVFSHVSFKNSKIKLALKPNEDFELNPVLNTQSEQLGELIIESKSNKKQIEGLTTIDPVVIRKITNFSE